MRNELSSRDEIAYQEFLEGEARNAARTMVRLAAWLFPAFSFLDYFSQRAQFFNLSIIRFSTTAIYVVLYLMMKKGVMLKKPFLTGRVLLSIAATSITFMCAILDGYKSPYYAGVNLVILAGVLLLPGGGRYMATTSSILLGLYTFGVLIFSSAPFDHPEVFINNLFFLVSTAVIGVSAAYFSDRVRRESFFRFREIERSAEVLQTELKSRHRSIEGLAHEIVGQKTEAERALELGNNFISMASHELKTPLTSLKLQIELTRRKMDHPSPEPAVDQKFLAAVDSQVTRLVKIVDDMLDVSRIQSGRLDLEKSEVDLDELVDDILSRHFVLDPKSKDLIHKESTLTRRGNWDPYKIEQVILNLLTNARRYGKSKPITITLSEENNFALISVKDQGIGISIADQKRVFERFERGNASKDYGGLGLGLYICKQIVETHGGQINVVSGPEAGSDFRVLLPFNA